MSGVVQLKAVQEANIWHAPQTPRFRSEPEMLLPLSCPSGHPVRKTRSPGHEKNCANVAVISVTLLGIARPPQRLLRTRCICCNVFHEGRLFCIIKV